jgi:hypothetical protein
MKTIMRYLPFLLFWINTHTASSQCLSGDCVNGKGKAKYYLGIYEGEFKDGLPNGKGQYSGLVDVGSMNLDSVKDVGLFQEGMFIKGKRAILASWERFACNLPHHQKYAGKFPEVDGFFVLPSSKPPREMDYPRELVITENGALGKKTIHRQVYEGNYQDTDFYWDGKFEKGLMHGDGVFSTLSGSFNVRFEKGKPTGEATNIRGNWSKTANFHLSHIAFSDGKVSRLKFYNGQGDSLISDFKYNVFKLEDLMFCEGFYNIRYKNGQTYKGYVENGIPQGYGELKQVNGSSYRGFFYRGFSHGLGTFLQGETVQDSGIYVFSKLMKGKFTEANKSKPYPICLSGDCENGFGKANYSVVANAAITNIYEGNFVNGLPFGFGEQTYQNGENKHAKRGTFSAGQLMGQGTITANYGNLRKITGLFQSDTLLQGTIEFSDGTWYEAEKMLPLVFGIHKNKNVSGIGTYYTKGGSIVKGKFYDDESNTVFKANYRRADGVVFDFDYNLNDAAKQYGISYNYSIEQLDRMAADILVKKEQAIADREYQKKQYAYEKEKREKQMAANAKEENWKEEEHIEKCGGCAGAGYIIYHNSSARDTYKKGNYISGPGEDTWKYVIDNNGKCRACIGKGKVKVKRRTYIGPTY